MREELLQKIKEDESLLHLFLIVKLNNFTFAEQRKGLARTKTDANFRKLSYEDFAYLDYLIGKWKNTKEDTVDEIVEEEVKRKVRNIEAQDLEPPTIEEQIEAKEKLRTLKLKEHKLYLADLEELKENIDLEFIIRAFFVFYELAVKSDTGLLFSIGNFIKSIEDCKEEDVKTSLKNYIKDLLKVKSREPIEVNLETIKASLTEEELKNYTYYFHLCRIVDILKRAFLSHTKDKLFSYSRERIEEKLEKYNKEPKKEDIEAFIRTLEDATTQTYKDLSTKEALEKLIGIILAFIDYARKCDEANLSFATTLSEIKEEYNIAFIEVEEDEEPLEVIAEAEEERSRLLTTKYLEVKENLSKIVANEFLEESKTNEPVRELFKAYASKDLEDILKEDLETTETPRTFLESLNLSKEEAKKEEHLEDIEEGLEEDIELTNEEIELAKLNKWTKTNVSLINNDIKLASQRVANFNEKPLATKINRLKELESKNTLTEEELEEKQELKDNIEEALREKERLESKLEDANEDLKELREDYINERDTKNKKELGRLIKKIEKDTTSIKTLIDEKFTKTGSYLQLSQDFTTGAELLVSNEGNIQLTINNNDLRKYNAEVERLVYYIENIFYHTLEENRGYYLIDIDDYAERTGRKYSTKLLKNIDDALEVLQNETFIQIGQYKGLNFKGKIKRLGSYFTIEPKGSYEEIENASRKTGYIITLDKAYSDILWHNKGQYWASIPNAIMKLKNPLTRGLGFYLYETLKKGIKEPGYYVRKFYMKTIIDALNKRGLLATNTNNRYSRRVIEPLRDAFNELKDIKLISYEEEGKGKNKDTTNPFKYYDEFLVGKKNLEQVFEQLTITIKFLVYDKGLYDKILTTNVKYSKERKKKKATNKK